MKKLFLDATGNYSNPRETDYLYLRADGTYAKPDREYLFLDHEGHWSETNVDEDFCYSVYIDDGVYSAPDALGYDDDCTDFTPADHDSLNSWERFVKRHFRPCVIKPEKEEPEYFLQHDNMTLKVNGEKADLTGADGDVMIQYPRMYAHLTYVNDTAYKISLTGKRQNKDDICFTKFGDVEYDYAYRGAFEASKDEKSNALRSVAGKGPWMNLTVSEYRENAQVRGSNYIQNNYQSILLWQLMFVLVYRTRASQATLGYGITNTDGPVATGSTASKPFCYGNNKDDSINESVKLFGVEDVWGNAREWVDGIIFDTNTYKATIDPSKYNNEGTGYEWTYQVKEDSFTANMGYLRKVVNDSSHFMFMPIDSSGQSNELYYCSYAGRLMNDTPYCLDYGGNYNSGQNCGIFCMYFGMNSDSTDSRYGSRLCRYN